MMSYEQLVEELERLQLCLKVESERQDADRHLAKRFNHFAAESEDLLEKVREWGGGPSNN